jgi:hypothetical protein
LSGVGGEEGVGAAGAVEFVGGLGLGREVADLRGGELHAGGKFVGGDAGLEFGVAGVAGGVALVEQLGEAAGSFIGLFADGGGAFEVADGLQGVEGDALVLGGEEAGGPVGGAGGGDAADVGDGDIGGEIVVHGPEGVAGPGAGGGEAFKDEAGIHGDAGGAVGVGPGGHGMDEGHAVGEGAEVGELFGDPFAGLAALDELPGAAHEVAVGALEGDLFFAAGHGLAGAFFEFGFVVEGVEVGDAAGAEDLDDAFGLWGEVGLAAVKKAGEGDGAEAVDELAAASGHRRTHWC